MLSTARIESPSAQLEAEMRREIMSGRWDEGLPGIRKIIAEYDVTRTTVERALASLSKSGWIVPGGKGNAWRPSKGIARKRANPGTLMLMGQAVEHRASDRARLEALMSRLPQPVVTLCLESDLPDTDYILQRVKAAGIRRVLVRDHPTPVAEKLAEAGFDVVMLGGSGAARKASQVLINMELIIKEALRHAFAAGHRRVCFPIWYYTPELALLIRRWVAEEYASAKLRHVPDFDAPVIEERTPEALHACLRPLLRHTPPTAFICSSQWIWLALWGLLNEAGKVVPRDASLISLFVGQGWEMLPQSQMHLGWPEAAWLKAVLNLVKRQDEGKSPQSVILPPVWIPGASLGPPKSAK